MLAPSFGLWAVGSSGPEVRRADSMNALRQHVLTRCYLIFLDDVLMLPRHFTTPKPNPEKVPHHAQGHQRFRRRRSPTKSCDRGCLI
jgi:hypothetical protein